MAQTGKEAELVEQAALAEAQEFPLVLGKEVAGIARYFPVEDSERRLAGRMPWE